MLKTAITTGPKDHGRRMSLADYDHVEVIGGHRYELSRGVITVGEWPDVRHLEQVCAINQQLYVYSAFRPKTISIIGNAAMSKIMAETHESERHPDISVYKTRPPDSDDIWRIWVPEIVIEVVSQTSQRSDYEEKPPEYLAFGVAEYWIVDEPKQQVTVLRREGGQWKTSVLTPTDKFKTPLLPHFELNIQQVFAAAASVS